MTQFYMDFSWNLLRVCDPSQWTSASIMQLFVHVSRRDGSHIREPITVWKVGEIHGKPGNTAQWCVKRWAVLVKQLIVCSGVIFGFSDNPWMGQSCSSSLLHRLDTPLSLLCCFRSKTAITQFPKLFLSHWLVDSVVAERPRGPAVLKRQCACVT